MQLNNNSSSINWKKHINTSSNSIIYRNFSKYEA